MLSSFSDELMKLAVSKAWVERLVESGVAKRLKAGFDADKKSGYHARRMSWTLRKTKKWQGEGKFGYKSTPENLSRGLHHVPGPNEAAAFRSIMKSHNRARDAVGKFNKSGPLEVATGTPATQHDVYRRGKNLQALLDGTWQDQKRYKAATSGTGISLEDLLDGTWKPYPRNSPGVSATLRLGKRGAPPRNPVFPFRPSSEATIADRKRSASYDEHRRDVYNKNLRTKAEAAEAAEAARKERVAQYLALKK